MPTLTAQSLIDKARTILQDTGTRFPDAEMLGWLNDAQREISALRPDATNKTEALALAAGVKQSIPATGSALVEVICNTNGTGIRQVSMDLLNVQRPSWRTETAAATKHFMFDPRTPKVFYVYPPAVAAASVDIKYQAPPTDVSPINAVISLDDIFGNAVIDYLVYRATSKDAEYSANLERALAARKAFENTLGLKAQADAAAAPSTGAAL